MPAKMRRSEEAKKQETTKGGQAKSAKQVKKVTAPGAIKKQPITAKKVQSPATKPASDKSQPKKSSVNKKDEAKSSAKASQKSAGKGPSVVGPKPKKPLSAYFVYNQEQTAILRAKNPDMPITETSKIVSEQWKELSDAQKKPYIEKAAKEKQLYEKRFTEWKNKGVFKFEDGSLSTNPKNLDRVQKMSCPENTPKPKNARNALCFFSKEFKVPEGTSIGVRQKLVMEKWNAMNNKQKHKFEQLASEDKKRYNKEMQSVHLHGYFLLEDGSKSSDKVLKKRAHSADASQATEPVKRQKKEPAEKPQKKAEPAKAAKNGKK